MAWICGKDDPKGLAPIKDGKACPVCGNIGRGDNSTAPEKAVPP